MAVSKNTRGSAPDTNAVFQKFFQNSQVSDERERAWHQAIRHAGGGMGLLGSGSDRTTNSASILSMSIETSTGFGMISDQHFPGALDR